MAKVLVVGTATQDVFLKSAAFKVLHDPAHLKKIGFPTGEAQCFSLGAKVEVDEPVIAPGGGAANAAVTFARDLQDVICITSIGKDSAGELVVKHLEKEGVEVRAQYTNEHTGFSVVLLSEGGERTILHHRGAASLLSRDAIPSNEHFDAGYIVPGNNSVEVIRRVVDVLGKNHAVAAINPSAPYLKQPRVLLPILRKVQVVIMNREEAAFLTNIAYEKEKEIFVALDKLVPGIVVMTEGEYGAVASDGKHIYRVAPALATAVDQTGAGDAFGSAFLAALIRRGGCIHNGKLQVDSDDIVYALKCASLNSAAVVSKIGAQAGILTSYPQNKLSLIKVAIK